MSNNASINANQCGVTVDSSGSNAVGVVGSATLNALSLGTVSNSWNNGSNINNNGQITSSTKNIQGITTQCRASPYGADSSQRIAMLQQSDPGLDGGEQLHRGLHAAPSR